MQLVLHQVEMFLDDAPVSHFVVVAAVAVAAGSALTRVIAKATEQGDSSARDFVPKFRDHEAAEDYFEVPDWERPHLFGCNKILVGGLFLIHAVRDSGLNYSGRLKELE